MVDKSGITRRKCSEDQHQRNSLSLMSCQGLSRIQLVG